MRSRWPPAKLFFSPMRARRLKQAQFVLLMESFADPEVGCVSGALMLGDPESGEAGKGMGLYWTIEKKIRELESASGSVVGATGAIYGVRRELLGIGAGRNHSGRCFYSDAGRAAGEARDLRFARPRLG